MRTSVSRRGPALRSMVIVAGVVALLGLSPAAWAAHGQAPGADPGGVPPVLSWLGGLVDSLLSGIESLWEAAGSDGEARDGSTTTVETQDGPTCDPTTTEMGCGMDPNG